MKEIKELDNKYFLLKIDDIKKLDFKSQVMLGDIARKVELTRKSEGKKENSYVVLNLDDEIDLEYLEGAIGRCLPPYKFPEAELKPHRVKEIAVDLVNAVLKTKSD